MSKKIIGVMGSPHRGGKVDTMLDELLNAAKEAGNEVRKINLFDQNIKYCKGCLTCRKNIKCCITDDDLNELAKDFVKADVIILAAPTYWANVPAIVKNFFDRMVGYVMTKDARGLPKPRMSKSQKYVLISACTTPFPFNRLAKQSTGCIRAMTEFFKYAGLTHEATVVLTGTQNMEKVPPKFINRVREIGKNL